MNRFWESVIRPVVEAAEPRTLIEVGSRGGALTAQLLGFCARVGAVVHVIDPAPSFDPEAWRSEHGERFVFHRELSLEALPHLPAPDAVFIDGDHNWYTVYHELKALEAKAKGPDASFPLVFLHDVHWPYGRRDLYYDPSTIPEEHRHEYAKLGILPGRRRLVQSGGINSDLDNALAEFGPRNGVLAAVEDFLEETSEPLHLKQVSGLHGLGLLVPERVLDKPHLRETVARLEDAGFLAEHCQLIERHRIDEIVRRTRYAGALADSRRELAAAEVRVSQARSGPVWRWAARLARWIRRLTPGLSPWDDPMAGVERQLRRANDVLDQAERRARRRRDGGNEAAGPSDD